MFMSAQPIMKSTWIMDLFTPRALHSSSVMFSKPFTQSAKPRPIARWQAAFSSKSVL